MFRSGLREEILRANAIFARFPRRFVIGPVEAKAVAEENDEKLKNTAIRKSNGKIILQIELEEAD